VVGVGVKDSLRRYYDPNAKGIFGIAVGGVVVGAVAREWLLVVLSLAIALYMGWVLYQAEQRWRASE